MFCLFATWFYITIKMCLWMPEFFSGYFRDTVGSYDGMFYINGSIGAFIGFLWLAEPFLMRCSLRLPKQGQAIPVWYLSLT